MGGHHGDETYKLPHYSEYKVCDAPELVKVQNNLARIGLKNPWLRNEVWKYTTSAHHKTFRNGVTNYLKYGFKYGVPAGILTYAIEEAYFSRYYEKPENKYTPHH